MLFRSQFNWRENLRFNIQIHAPVELAKSDQRKGLATECLPMRTSGPLSDLRPLHMGMSCNKAKVAQPIRIKEVEEVRRSQKLHWAFQ